MYSNLLLSLFVFLELIQYDQAYWIRDLSYCPRKRDSNRQRQCFKSCFDDRDCRSRYRSCVCDYDCGMSCVKRGMTCPFLTPPEHGRISYSNENQFGSRATYECEQGYVLEGPKHRHCQGDMWWGPSDSIPYCTKEVFCHRPADIIHAVNDIPSTISTFHVGYSVKYTCLTGYVGHGTNTSECTFLGQWTFATLKCVPIDCGSPGLLRNGFLSGERFDYPNMIAFFCNEGYELIGKETTRACQENGLWSGTMPICQKKKCGPPPIASHSEIIQPDRTSNTTIQYICQACDDPQLTFNGHIESSTTTTYAVDSIVRFYCPSNLTLRGSSISKCHINGSWIPKIPQCRKPIPCLVPLLPSNARYLIDSPLGEQMPDGSQLKYICGNSRFHRQITCRRGRIFPRLPRCFHGCRVPNDSVKCIQGYQPVNESGVVRCLKHGQWSHHAHCVPMSCKKHPPTIDHGRSIFHSTMHGSIARYRCYPGYRLVNNHPTKLTCQFGVWLPAQPPRCLPIFCPNPGPLKNGRIYVVMRDQRLSAISIRKEFRSYIPTVIHGRTIEFECDSGYVLHGSTGLTCHYGQWIPAERPRCIMDAFQF